MIVAAMAKLPRWAVANHIVRPHAHAHPNIETETVPRREENEFGPHLVNVLEHPHRPAIPTIPAVETETETETAHPDDDLVHLYHIELETAHHQEICQIGEQERGHEHRQELGHHLGQELLQELELLLVPGLLFVPELHLAREHHQGGFLQEETTIDEKE